MRDKGLLQTLRTDPSCRGLESVFSYLVCSGLNPPDTPAARAYFYARRVMGWERARVTDRSDDPGIQFGARRWSTPLCRALRGHCRRRLILDPQAGGIPPELSAVLKHEPERRSGAAQPALLVRLEGKTVQGEWDTNHVEKVWSSDQVCFWFHVRSAGGFLIREPSWVFRVETALFSHSGKIGPEVGQISSTRLLYLTHFTQGRILSWECFTVFPSRSFFCACLSQRSM